MIFRTALRRGRRRRKISADSMQQPGLLSMLPTRGIFVRDILWRRL
jgi:hypothetical protein